MTVYGSINEITRSLGNSGMFDGGFATVMTRSML
jgi:hypothetical protein